jgi:hypothetical protein
MVVKGRGELTTPAGDFNTWRVEISAQGSARGNGSSNPWR